MPAGEEFRACFMSARHLAVPGAKLAHKHISHQKENLAASSHRRSRTLRAAGVKGRLGDTAKTIVLTTSGSTSFHAVSRLASVSCNMVPIGKIA